MGPLIGRAIGQGFRATNKSWAGMGFYALCWFVVLAFVLLALVLTKIPEEAFRPPVMQQLAPSLAEGPGEEAPLAVEAQEAARREQERQTRIMLEWIGRAWPVLLICVIVLVAAGAWLYAGQVGYLVTRIQGEPARISEFWVTGTRAFWPVLGGTFLWFLGLVGLVLVVALIAMVVGLLKGAIDAVVGLVLAIAGIGALIWLLVRIVFWFIAIVVDHLGPIAGLRASFRATRGRWWKTLWLLGLFMLIAFGVGLPLVLLEFLGRTVGGFGGAIIGLISNLLQLLVMNLYLVFVMTAGLIRFYEDTKPTPASVSPATP